MYKINWMFALFIALLSINPLSAYGQLLDEGTISRMASDPLWLRLLHYEKPVAIPGKSKSAIHSEDFFLSPSGSDDPRKELEAALVEMQSINNEPDKDIRCRFPARVSWIETQTDMKHDFDYKQLCPAFYTWTHGNSGVATDMRITSISIVLATGYLGNPASYYGHTLLKFNSHTSDNSSDLLDKTVNYGAFSTRGDNPASYIIKSILGGYDAGFSQIDFYFHENMYGENENRDLWEYQLDLPQTDVDFVVAHAWEVLGKKYTYYFFRQNCAYRMAEIVQVLPGLDIIPHERPFTIPQTLTQKLVHATYAGHPLIAKVVYYPSRQSRFYEKYLKLKPQQAALLKRMVRQGVDINIADVNALPVDTKQQIVDGVIDYYRFTNENPQAPTSQLDPNYLKAVAARFVLPPGGAQETIQREISPDMGRPPSWAQIGEMYSSHDGNAISLRIRPAYYDQLDGDGSHIRNASLTMGDTQLSIKEGNIKLHRFDLVSVDSANQGVSGLANDRGLAWKVRVGAEQAFTGCLNCLVARGQADIGMGRQVTQHTFLAGYVGGGLQTDKYDQGVAFARASLEVISRFDEYGLGMKANIEHRQGLESGIQSQIFFRGEIRWVVLSGLDLRLDYEHSDGPGSGEVLIASIGSYW